MKNNKLRNINLQMFATSELTKLEHLIDPEVFADIIPMELEKAIKLTPLAEIDRTLQGRPGSTVTVPSWKYIGPAEEVGEGEAIPTSKLEQGKETMTIKKAGKGVEITDEAVLSGIGNPLGEGAKQIALAIADKIDNDLVEQLGTATQKTKTLAGTFTVDNLQAGIDIFDDEDDEQIILVTNPANATELRNDGIKNWLSATEIGADRAVKGAYGEILGVQILRSRRIPKNTGYLVKAGALKILLKRDTMVEPVRDAEHGINKFFANKHYGVYLYNQKKVVKIAVDGKAPTTTGVGA